MDDLVERLRSFASGCRGSMWQSRDKTISLCDEAADEITALRARLEDANASVVAFCAPAALEYAREMGLPDGHLHPTHYDILEKAGARMDSFTRADLAQIEERGE